ncbi:leucine-rich repeat containing protein, putative [Entamoeba dispar SAW760]|uniref:Leucine-rich repeat containing protein, putative n=1 Tax=Entamoeba dispar (strain ATCC PRA-260 / SAW760) TaxID=370354 RepID=B0E732_ENTDS|nr:leucine-rich repeat containing protein, putative [Entamoeba dispar SAW760]EDR29643.1 leucine-rich repeat containing protein, putative [Entamoeba dispar SAW760]|eukprot:EDR29643.1 leucine-rich repeat containing protein, putative [Entamoeba dispar SAW760]
MAEKTETKIVKHAKNLTEFPQEEVKKEIKTVVLIDVSMNRIQEIPSQINSIAKLQKFRGNDNMIKTLPSQINIPSLKTLDLSSNHLKRFCKSIKLTSLTEINLSINQITKIDDDFGSLHALRFMDLSINRIQSVPKHLSKLTSLTFIDISNNLLTSFPTPLLELSSLIVLKVKENKITTIPNGMSKMSNLQILDISNNKIDKITPSLCKLTKLSVLDVSANPINEINDQIQNLTTIKEIDISYSPLKTLPKSFMSLVGLRKLTLQHTSVKVPPAGLQKFTKVSELNLSNGEFEKVTELPCSGDIDLSCNQIIELDLPDMEYSIHKLNLGQNRLKDFPNIKCLREIKTLILQKNMLGSIPLEMFTGSSLTALDLSSNSFNAFPMSITTCTNLVVLNMSNNYLDSLPDISYNCFAKLEALLLGINIIDRLPETMSELTNLTTLHLEHNKLSKIPESLFSMTKLVELFLNCNQIPELPEKFSLLTNLEILELSCNYIKEITPIVNLVGIKDLDLSTNQIEKCPSDLCGMTSLRSLDLSYNGDYSNTENFPMFFTSSLTRLTNFHCTMNDKVKLNKFSSSLKTPITGPVIFTSQTPLEHFSLGKPNSMRFNSVAISNDTFSVGSSEMCGNRDQMEDALIIIENFTAGGVHLVGLFDGHGGAESSNFVACHFARILKKHLMTENNLGIDAALIETFNELSNEVNKKEFNDGTTACVLLVTPNEYYTAHVGDSRAIVVRKQDYEQLTEDDKAYNEHEIQRVVDVGGYITKGRVNGVLAITRSIGDVRFQPFVSSEPHVNRYVRRKDTDMCIVLGCDGVWDVLSNSKVADICRKKEGTKRMSEIAGYIRDMAYILGSEDNISCVVCHF